MDLDPDEDGLAGDLRDMPSGAQDAGGIRDSAGGRRRPEGRDADARAAANALRRERLDRAKSSPSHPSRKDKDAARVGAPGIRHPAHESPGHTRGCANGITLARYAAVRGNSVGGCGGCASLQRSWRGCGRRSAGADAGLRWTAPESWHITLQFLGNATRGAVRLPAGAAGRGAERAGSRAIGRTWLF